MNIFSKEKNDYELKKDIYERMSNETGRERLIKMFRRNEFGELSPELLYVSQTGVGAFALTGLLGAFSKMKHTRDDYIRKNMASAYESEFLARRSLTDTMSLSGIKAAVKTGIKYGSFSSLYLLMTLTAANYNNKVTIWEHMASGALLGSLARINFGLKGAAAAGTLGGILGMFAGGIIIGSMWISGTSVEELRYWNHKYYEDQYKIKPDLKNNHRSTLKNVW